MPSAMQPHSKDWNSVFEQEQKFRKETLDKLLIRSQTHKLLKRRVVGVDVGSVLARTDKRDSQCSRTNYH